MKPSRMQLFFAREWPTKIWVAAIMLGFMSGAWWWCGWPSGWGIVFWVPVIALAGVMGFFSAVLFGFFALGPVYYSMALRNGAPFVEGDRVRILVGQHRGTVTTVYSRWQGEDVRVELGKPEKELLKDIFGPHQLLREPSGQGRDSA